MRLPIRSRSTASTASRDHGQSLVELALILPVFLLLLLTALDLGRLLYSQITITNAAKEGALVASQGGTYQSNQPCSDTNTVMCGVLTEAKGGFIEVDRTRVTLAPATCDPQAMYPSSGLPPDVAVSVQAPFRVITPIIGSFVGSNLILASTAEAQCLVAPRVTYPTPPPPTAAFTASPTAGVVPPALTVNVDASSSSSPGATITSYTWSFGGSGVTSSTSYSAPGTYSIVLTVTDSRGQTATASRTITVTGAGPTPSCPPVTFTWAAVTGTPHVVDFEAAKPGTGPWAYVWSGDVIATGQKVNNWDFKAAGTYSVTVTATNGSCIVTSTQSVTVP